MRNGADPYAELFSSQGPLFLPVLRMGDMFGAIGPRLIMLLSAGVLVAGSYVLVRRCGGQNAAIVAGIAAAASLSLYSVTTGVASDGPALAFAMTAMLVASWGRLPVLARALAAGALVGAALSIKSLFVLPAGLAVGWYLLRALGLRALALAAVAAGAVGFTSALVWGLSDVWDQYVVYHLEASAERTFFRNLLEIGWVFVRGEWAALVLLFSVVIVAARRGPREWLAGWTQDRAESRHLVESVAVWVGAAGIVLLIHAPLFNRHVAFLAIPVIVLAGILGGPMNRRVWWVALLVAALQTAVIVRPLDTDAEAPAGQAVALMSELETAHLAISDEPAIPFWAGFSTHPDLADPSTVRIDAGRLSSSDVLAAAADERVCAVLLWSGRFASIGLDVNSFDSFETFGTWDGERYLLARPPCLPPG
jgi:hypothetical protein